MRDLEIRGAGNLLGPEQHGFIASVGFELYCRLLEESIKELRGEAVVAPPEPVLDLQADAFISDDFVEDPGQKVELYQKIIALDSLEACDDLEEEIQDRFGDLPQAVRNLLQIARIKVFSRFLGISHITARKNKFEIRFLEGLAIEAEKYATLYQHYRGKISYRHGRIGQLLVEKDPVDEQALLFLTEVLAAIRDE